MSCVIWLFLSACEEQDYEIVEGTEVGDCADGIDNDSDGLLIVKMRGVLQNRLY